jgi:hypothetical protein
MSNGVRARWALPKARANRDEKKVEGYQGKSAEVIAWNCNSVLGVESETRMGGGG